MQYPHLTGNRSLGKKMAVKAVILEFVQLLGTQQSRNGFTEVIVSPQQTNLNHLYHPWDGHVPFKLYVSVFYF